MCGIAGKVGEFDPFQIMGLIHSNRVRGIEGFGAAWPKKNKWAFAKRAGDFADHMADRTFQSAFSQHCLLAHTRAASGGLGRGSRDTANNAHPWVCGNTLMAHNGRFRNDETQSAKYVKDYNWDVDSDALCAVIDSVGMEKAFGEFEGTAGIWLADRLDPRQFWLWCWDQDLAIWSGEGGFVFSSELRHLVQWGFTSANGTVGEVDRNKGCLFKVDTQTGEFEITTVEGYKPPPKQIAPTRYAQYSIYLDVGDRVYWRDRVTQQREYGTVTDIRAASGKCLVRQDGKTYEVWRDEQDLMYTQVGDEKKEKESGGIIGTVFPASTMASILSGKSVQVCPFCGTLGKPMCECQTCGELADLNHDIVHCVAECIMCSWIGDYHSMPRESTSGSIDLDCPVCNTQTISHMASQEAGNRGIIKAFARFYTRDGIAWDIEETAAYSLLTTDQQEMYKAQRALVENDEIRF